MRLFLAFLTGAFLAGCGKGPSEPPQNPSEPVQYGIPFTGVPNPRDAVIYQVNIRAFSTKGDFAGVRARLDAIKALGVNVLYLLPTYPVGVLKSVNSPYCIKDYMAVNPEFGSLDDLRALVADAHKRGMAVLLDWVADHTSWDNSWIYHESWYKHGVEKTIISPPGTGWLDVAALNYDNAEMRKSMIDAMSYWVYAANIDGYRCDAADFVPFDFWREAIRSLRAIPGHSLLFLAEGIRDDQFTAGFDLEYGMRFYSNLADNIYAKHGSAKSIDSLNTAEYVHAQPDNRVVRYITNHDIDQSGTPLDLLNGKDGSMAAFVVASCMKGVPMIYDGQEVGCRVKLQFLSKGTVIDWTLNPGLAAEYQKIISFMNGSQALKGSDPHSFSNDDICAFTKSSGKEEVFVVVNLRNESETYATPAGLTGTIWENISDGTSVTLTNRMALRPYQYQILEKPGM